MSTQTGPTPDTPDLPDDPEAVVAEISEPSGEDYDPPEQVDPDREATEADMLAQAAEVPADEEDVVPAGE
ncbi:hypothetical protein V2J52_10030 [Georgenia sp. MJ173]|uniref:hypothetical protein n=1 Tax=Georgenia sunbinii TaxID=3117728 RepID=UPI002F2690CC